MDFVTSIPGRDFDWWYPKKIGGSVIRAAWSARQNASLSGAAAIFTTDSQCGHMLLVRRG
jgi:hypothetical protein